MRPCGSPKPSETTRIANMGGELTRPSIPRDIQRRTASARWETAFSRQSGGPGPQSQELRLCGRHRWQSHRDPESLLPQATRQTPRSAQIEARQVQKEVQAYHSRRWLPVLVAFASLADAQMRASKRCIGNGENRRSSSFTPWPIGSITTTMRSASGTTSHTAGALREKCAAP
jgi:hypothetical protein